MTKNKHRKQRIRKRMEKTSESYTSARKQILQKQKIEKPTDDPKKFDHMPGTIAATTCLRILLTQLGMVHPVTRLPFSEAMLFGICGGIGAGVFSFHYEKENFSTFYIAGRHLWQDDLAYLQKACERFGVPCRIWETQGSRSAQTHLREAQSTGQPFIAWVDMGLLPYRAMPSIWEGSGYHVVVVYQIDYERKEVLLGDMSPKPIRISLEEFSQARSRIQKQKNRLFALETPKEKPDLKTLILAGLRACTENLSKGRMKSFTLHAFRDWAQKLSKSRAKDSWEKRFSTEKNLWRALTSVYDFIEYHGTGGGLCRSIFGEFLQESALIFQDEKLNVLGTHYKTLGKNWSNLARTALSDPTLQPIRTLYEKKATLFATKGPDAAKDIQEIWDNINKHFQIFKVDQNRALVLREKLTKHLLEICQKEEDGLQEIQTYLALHSR